MNQIERVKVIPVVLGTVCVVAVLTLGTRTCSRWLAESRELNCYSNLKRISLALQDYADVHGAYPPAVLKSPEGDPLHSWRVLLLPYVGEEELYERFRLDEPWNSPHNIELKDRIPDLYRCPSDDSKPCFTSYLAVVDDDCGLYIRDPKTSKLPGPCGVAAIIETTGREVLWIEPIDLTVDEVGKAESQKPNHPDGNQFFAPTISREFVQPGDVPESLERARQSVKYARQQR
jgi:hypothetical protein